MTQTTVVSNEEVEGLVAEWAHLTHLQGPPRLCTLPGAWSLWCKPQSLMRLGGERVVRGTVVRGSVSKFGFGKLMRERFLPHNPRGKQQAADGKRPPRLEGQRLLRNIYIIQQRKI